MSQLLSFLKVKVIKETIWSFLSKGISMILFLLLNIFLARSLDVDKFGEWSFFLSIITIISVLSYFGINNATGRYIALHNKTESLREVIISSLTLRLFFSFAFSLAVLILHETIAIFVGKPELSRLLLYAVPLIFFSGLTEYLKEVFTALHRIKYNFIITLLEFGLKLIITIICLSFFQDIIVIINSFALSLLITVLFGAYFLYKNFYKGLQGNNIQFKKDILRYSYPLVFVSLGFLALTEIDTVMIGMFSNDTEVGLYAVAKQIILKLPHISVALAMGSSAFFAKIDEANRMELKNKLFKLLKLNSVVFLVIILLIITTAPFFIPLLFGNTYIKAVLPLKILTVYLFFYSNSIILSSFLDYSGHAKKRAWNMLITIILNIILNIILIPAYGAVGASVATTVSFIPYVILNWIEVKKSLK